MDDNDDGPCTDCDDTGITIQTERRCACQPVEAKEPTLADLIEGRLLGVHPDDQDLALDDADWLAILAALRAREVSDDMVGTGRFLLDRLVDHEVRMTSDGDASEWFGHVTPAMARFRAALRAMENSDAS